MPALVHRRWTPDDVRRLMEEYPGPLPRYEVVRGELLVTSAPSSLHQRIVFEIAELLDAYVRTHHLGEVRISPSDLRPIPDVLLQPDLFVIPARDGRRAPMEDPVTRVSLAVEVLSPSSARFDRVIKRQVFGEYRLAEYWIVDPDARTVERWRPHDDRPEVVDGVVTWEPPTIAEQFTLDIPALFREVLD